MSLMFDRNPLKPLTQLVRGIAYLLADAEDGGELIGTTGQLFWAPNGSKTDLSIGEGLLWNRVNCI